MAKTAARKWIESNNLGLLEAIQLRNELSHWISEWSQEQQDEAYKEMYEIEMADRQNGEGDGDAT